jgi:hypothetical protein
MGTTIYPEAFRLAFWKTSSTGMSPFGTSGTLSGPTVYGSPEIQFNRATLGCIIDDTALNYNPNATEDDGSCIADFQTVSYEEASTDVVVPFNGNDTYPLINLTRSSDVGRLTLHYVIGEYADYDGGSAAWGTDFYLSSGEGSDWPGTNTQGNVFFDYGVVTRTLRLRILGTNSPGVPDRTDSDTIYLHLDNASYQAPQGSYDLPVVITGTTPEGLQDTVKHVVNILPPDEGNTFTLTLGVASDSQGDGYVTSEGTLTYTQGTEVTIEATPFQGSIFDNWVGDIGVAGGNQYNSQTTITMNGNYTIEAYFGEGGE